MAPGCGEKASDLSERCRAAGSDRLQSAGLQVYRGSSLNAGELQVGTIPTCSSNAQATQIYLLARRALAMIPKDLRPEEVSIHVSPTLNAKTPPIDVTEVHRETNSILVDARSLKRIDLSTMLHEMAHVQMASRAPSGMIAARLEESLGEGIADYYAATIQGSPSLGKIKGKAARDLSERPVWLRGGWTKLADASKSWSAHEQGWALAALLWSQQKEPGAMLRDLITCMKSARLDSSESPARVIDSWLGGCPASSRESLGQLMHRWIPSSMY
jgi:hypothetical protein